MSATGRWFVTPHAVARYRERIDRRVSYEEALDRLLAMSAAAHRTCVREDGTEEWRVGRAHGKLRFRVQPSAQSGALPVLLSVLTAFDGMTPRF